MNLQFSYNVEKFLSRWAISGFSRMTQLHGVSQFVCLFVRVNPKFHPVYSKTRSVSVVTQYGNFATVSANLTKFLWSCVRNKMLRYLYTKIQANMSPELKQCLHYYPTTGNWRTAVMASMCRVLIGGRGAWSLKGRTVCTCALKQTELRDNREHGYYKKNNTFRNILRVDKIDTKASFTL
jgi:hypothetical protein